MSIQAVLFDMGGTIDQYWYTPELRLNATPGLQQRLHQSGIDLGISNQELYEVITAGLERYHRFSVESEVELPTQRVWCEYILPGFSIDYSSLASIAEDLALYIETCWYHREMRPEIPEVLTAIQRLGLKTGLISNVNSLGQVPTNLKEYGIATYFDPIVLSSQYGWRKPDPAIFHYAARLIGEPTSRCAYIGDRVRRDISGARRAGYGLAVQIQHEIQNGEDDSGPAPDAMISNMTELLDILVAREKHLPAPCPAEHSALRAFLFDAGDILYSRPNRSKRMSAFLEPLSLRYYVDYSVHKMILTEQAFVGEISLDKYQEETLRLYGVRQAEDLTRGKQVLREIELDLNFFEGVVQTLHALKDKGYLLGVITDTAHPLHDKIRWLEIGGFGHLWDTIIASTEMGVRKPHPRMYQSALDQLHLTKQQAAFVGHKSSELDGARAVGLKTIAFNHDPDARADYYIKSLSELLEFTG